MLPILHVVLVCGVHTVVDVGAIGSSLAYLIDGAGIVGCNRRVRAAFILLYQHEICQNVDEDGA